MDWTALAARAADRYRDGEARLPDEPDARQRQLARMGNAAWAAGLAAVMAARHDDARSWLELAAERYLESYADAPAGSWGRPIAVLKARLLAGDGPGAEEAARWTLGEGAAQSASPIGRYAGALAHLLLGHWAEARVLADELRTAADFPHDVANALAFLAAEDVIGYTGAVESVLGSFERRDGYLEDLPVADTVLVLQALAARRGIRVELSSPLLPAAPRASRSRAAPGARTR